MTIDEYGHEEAHLAPGVEPEGKQEEEEEEEKDPQARKERDYFKEQEERLAQPSYPRLNHQQPIVGAARPEQDVGYW